MAESDEALQNCGHLDERPGSHALRVFLEAMLPVMMRIELALLEINQNFRSIAVSNDWTKPDRLSIGTRNHHFEGVRSDSQHVVGFGSPVEHSVTDLFNDAYAVIWIHYLVTDLKFHGRSSP